jgi:hypothetical protein
MGEIPIREENKRTITEKEAAELLASVVDPLFDYYEGDLESLPKLDSKQ